MSNGFMNVGSSNRLRALFPAVLVAGGLIMLQALIGGRVLLFAYPGYCLLGIAGLVGFASSRSKTGGDPLCLYGTAIFLGYVLVRAIATPGYFARPDLFSALGALVVYSLTVSALASSTARLAIFALLLTFASVHVFIGLIQFSRADNFMLIPFLQRVDYGQRASGFYVCPNHLAGMLEVVGIFGLSLTFWGRWPVWGKVLTAYATVVCYVGIALTGSRGGYLSVMMSLLAFAGLSVIVFRSARPLHWWKFGATALVATLACGLVAGGIIGKSGYLSERAGNIIDTKNMRVDLWRAALQQWRLQPLIGTGSGTYRFYGRQFRMERMQNDPVDVHNDYLHLLCEYGLVGAAAFLLFFSLHLRHGWRSLKRLADKRTGGQFASNRLALIIGALSAVAAYVVHSTVDFNLHIPANAMLLALVFGVLSNAGNSLRCVDSRPTPMLALGYALPVVALLLTVQAGRLCIGEYYAERARTALRDEKPLEAIRFAEKASEHEFKNPDIFFYIGRASAAAAHQSEKVKERLALYEKAIHGFQEANRLAPLDGGYPLDLAFTYDELGRFAEAEHMYEIARRRDPLSMSVVQLYKAHLELQEKPSSPSRQSL